MIEGYGTKELVDITVDGDTVVATDEHPFWVVGGDSGAWVDAEDLRAGDVLLTPQGVTRIDEVEHRIVFDHTVHNLTIAGLHTYHVAIGDHDVLTHNEDYLCELELRYKDGWTSEQVNAADVKVEALNQAASEGLLTKSVSDRSGTSASATWRSAGNEAPSGYDIDHVIELQLGGLDDLGNMSPLDLSVNRSIGSQIRHPLSDFPLGTKIQSVRIS